MDCSAPLAGRNILASLSLFWAGKVQYLSSMIKALVGRLRFDTESKLSIMQSDGSDSVNSSLLDLAEMQRSSCNNYSSYF